MNASQFFGAMFDPFRRLTDFSGRSTRSEFWPFVFLVFAIQQLATFALLSPVLEEIGRQAMAGNSDSGLPTSSKGFFHYAIAANTLVYLVFLLPLAGAAIRRLHDTNRSGYWTLPYAADHVWGLFFAWKMGDELLPASGNMIAAFSPPLIINALISWAITIGFVYLCAQDGTIGSNRYGPDPKGRSPDDMAL